LGWSPIGRASVRPFGLKPHRHQQQDRLSWSLIDSSSVRPVGWKFHWPQQQNKKKQIKGKHGIVMMFDIIYNVFMIRYISMYMCLNGTKHMYTIIAEMHQMIYVVFYVRRINIPISVNDIEHMYIITVGCIWWFI